MIFKFPSCSSSKMILIQQHSLVLIVQSLHNNFRLPQNLKTHKNGNTPYNTSKKKNNIIYYIQMTVIFLSKDIFIDDINTRKQ